MSNRSYYCSYCAKYGHLTTQCVFRQKESSYEIQSEDDIINRFMENNEEMILEIKENDRVIISYLAARGVRVLKSHNKKQKLEEYALLNNKRVVYVK